MSLRMIAKELYRLKKEKEDLSVRLLSATDEEKEALGNLLRKKQAEEEKMQKLLDGAKEPPGYRKPR